MGSRLELHDKFQEYIPNIYFQPPSNLQMIYPCIVYQRIPASTLFADNKRYKQIQGYNVMIIEKDPDSAIAGTLENDFEYCTIEQRYRVDNLHHATLTLYY